MNNKHFRVLVGKNIRRERVSRKLSVEELAIILEITPAYVGLIERGERGASLRVMSKLKEIFGVPIDNFFLSDLSSDITLSETQIKRNKLTSLITGLNDRELDFFIKTVKNLRAMNNAEVINNETKVSGDSD